MKVTTEEKVTDTTPAVSDERKEEIRDELSALNEQESKVMETLKETQENAEAELNNIQAERRELIEELLGDSVKPDAIDLTPEMADEAIAALKQEFDKTPEEQAKAGYIVQEDMDFAAVEAKLRTEENKEKLKVVYRMVQAGSHPAVVCEENGRFCIAETFGQTLPERANCVYDRKAEKQVGREHCNGNAVTQSQKMGVSLMERRIAEAHMVRFPDDSNQCCFDYIQATPEERERGRAPYVRRRGFGVAGVDLRVASYHFGVRGWRGALWV